MSQIHVIAHTHWDQEWYFTRQDSMVLASYNFAEVIETLEQDPAWQCYHLDGQMAVVDDFLAINPDYRPRLEKLVREKSVFVGPWFTQTDTYNVHGESIIRNLKYGIFAARALGHAMQVGYLPDTFGHNAQMPTILQGCNIDNIVFWRGIDHDTQAKNSQFLCARRQVQPSSPVQWRWGMVRPRTCARRPAICTARSTDGGSAAFTIAD